MKALLVGEYRKGKVLPQTYELAAFAQKAGAGFAMFLVGEESNPPKVDGKVYVADVSKHGDSGNPSHKALILDAAQKEGADVIVFSHSYYGWDMAPRVALALNAAEVAEVVGYENGEWIVPACNSKLRRAVKPKTEKTVVTLQAGAYGLSEEPSGSPQLETLDTDETDGVEFIGYEEEEKKGVDLTRSEVIVSAGRGIGKKENMDMIAALAETLGGDLGASRPVVDNGWAEAERQVGTSGVTVSPRLYVACGISGAVQHLAGMKNSGFIVAVNTDKEAPIAEEADVLVAADLKQFVPALTEKLKA